MWGRQEGKDYVGGRRERNVCWGDRRERIVCAACVGTGGEVLCTRGKGQIVEQGVGQTDVVQLGMLSMYIYWGSVVVLVLPTDSECVPKNSLESIRFLTSPIK